MSNYDLIERINNLMIDGVVFDKIEGYSCMGDIRINAYKHPIQYTAYATIAKGDDDAYEGVGWSPNEALRNL